MVDRLLCDPIDASIASFKPDTLSVLVLLVSWAPCPELLRCVLFVSSCPQPKVSAGVLCTTGASHIRKRTSPGTYRRPMPRILGGSSGGGAFLMGEVPL